MTERTFATAVLACDVVGVTFVDGYPENLHRLADLEEERTAGEPITVLLLREPENAADANAVAVHVPAVGKVGHIAASTASAIAPLLDAGHRAVADLYVRIHPEHPDRPGLTVTVLITKETTPA